MYYWIVKHAGSKVQDIVSHHEDLYTLQYPHIIIESLSPGLNGASFALGRRISTDSTWRDLNNSLVTYLKSQHVRKSKVELPLGVNLGANDPLQSRLL